MKNQGFSDSDSQEILKKLHGTGLSQDEKELICSIIREFWENPLVLSVYLYGSYARSIQKPYSDIDIAVITSSSKSSRKEKEYIGSFSSKKIDLQVFSDLPLPAKFQVFSYGIPLFVRDADSHRDLVRSVILTYMDCEPMRNRWKVRILG